MNELLIPEIMEPTDISRCAHGVQTTEHIFVAWSVLHTDQR